MRAMETKILLRLIKDDILHLQGIAEDFNIDSLPTADEVELALFRANALLRQLELLHKSLAKLDIPSNNIQPADEFKASPPEILIPEPEHVVHIPEIPEHHLPFTPSEDQKPADPPTLEAQVILEPSFQEEEIIQEEAAEAVIIAEKPSSSPIGDEITPADPSGETQQMVNDYLLQEKSELGYQLIPIRSIWDGIGINDRILYVRELFENNSSKFETAVTSLNQLSTIQEAVNYLKMNFKWRKTDASQKFLGLVKRRFTN
jgi:hypothetical protein